MGSKSVNLSTYHNENKFEDAKAVISSCNLLEQKQTETKQTNNGPENFRLSNMNHTNVKILLMCCGGGNNQIGYKKLNMTMIICDWHFLSLTSHDGDRPLSPLQSKGIDSPLFKILPDYICFS